MTASLPLFVEGAGSIMAVCTLPLLACSLVFLLAAGSDAPFAAAGYLVGAAIVAWIRFGGVASVELTRRGAVVAGLVLTGAAVTTALVRSVGARRYLVTSMAAVGGSVAAMAWRPCVGKELAKVLNGAGGRPLSSLGSMFFYVGGIGLLTIAISLISVAVPRVAPVFDSRVTTGFGIGLGAVFGLLLALGLWADVAESLLVRSSA